MSPFTEVMGALMFIGGLAVILLFVVWALKRLLGRRDETTRSSGDDPLRDLFRRK